MKTTTLLEPKQIITVPGTDPLLEDERLMEMIQAGTSDGLRLLHKRHAPLLKQVSRGVLHNEGDVEDLIQEVFVEIWNRAATYDPAKGRPMAWMITLARRRSIDRARKREARGRAVERFAEEIKVHDDRWTHVHEDLAHGERKQHLGRALAVLPTAQRDALQLAYYGQMSQRQVAAYTGLPLGTIKTRLELGLKKMAALLSGFEELLDAGTCGPGQRI